MCCQPPWQLKMLSAPGKMCTLLLRSLECLTLKGTWFWAVFGDRSCATIFGWDYQKNMCQLFGFAQMVIVVGRWYLTSGFGGTIHYHTVLSAKHQGFHLSAIGRPRWCTLRPPQSIPPETGGIDGIDVPTWRFIFFFGFATWHMARHSKRKSQVANSQATLGWLHGGADWQRWLATIVA